MSNPVIKVDGLSKAYQLGDFGTGTISRDLERYWARLRGKEDPFLKIGETNDRALKSDSPIVWSLKDLDFEIAQGDAVGIIGRNGAGKSTLLKILSRITTPTTGSFKVKGRIASLLEVGTGFHPDLSGRENIYLNGAILGMRKKEIARKFDEIVHFAGVERYIDTPVKRYSSGMYVRLAFAVAAHLESEILIVDEVLAVGDAEFQKKCLGKMNEVSTREGRTVLFVSHNIEAIIHLCNTCLFLNSGKLINIGETTNIVADYIQSQHLYLQSEKKDIELSSNIKIDLSTNYSFERTEIIFKLNVKATSTIKISDLAILIYNERELRIAIIDLRSELIKIKSSQSDLSIAGAINEINLLSGIYKFKIYLKSDLFEGDTQTLTQIIIDSPAPENLTPYPKAARGLVSFKHNIVNLKTN